MITHRGRLSFSSAEEGLDAGAGSFSADAPAAAAAGKARRKFEQVKLCLYVLKHFIHCCLFHSIVAYYNTLQPYTYQLLHITTHCNHTLTNCCILQHTATMHPPTVAQESEADFERLVAAPLLQVISDARSKTRDQANSSSADSSSNSNTRINAHAADDDGGAADRHHVTNPTLLVGGEYKPLGAISECLDVDEIEQVVSTCQLGHRDMECLSI
jgi:hypothetical protein